MVRHRCSEGLQPVLVHTWQAERSLGFLVLSQLPCDLGSLIIDTLKLFRRVHIFSLVAYLSCLFALSHGEVCRLALAGPSSSMLSATLIEFCTMLSRFSPFFSALLCHSLSFLSLLFCTVFGRQTRRELEYACFHISGAIIASTTTPLL